MDTNIKNPLFDLSASPTCRTALTRMYFSNHIKFLYLILIIFCLVDLIITVATWRQYPRNRWALILDLILNIIVLTDSFLRLYTMGVKQFCKFRSNWIEILVILLGIPEVLLLIIVLTIDRYLSENLEVISLIYSGIVIVLRPVVLCRRQTTTKVPSIHLYSTVVAEDSEKDLIREASRFDSVIEDTPILDGKKSVNS